MRQKWTGDFLMCDKRKNVVDVALVHSNMKRRIILAKEECEG
jgi:hypothetical protein